MTTFEAFLLGLIQGLTEFLPVSSSGHLQIVSTFLPNAAQADNLTFSIIVHAATVCATIVVLRKQILALLLSLLPNNWKTPEFQTVIKLLLSAIPIAIVGFCFKDTVENLFEGGLLVVGISLLATAILLAFGYFASPREKAKLSFFDAFIIGIAQACAAIFPGLSRSGTTIVTGILLGNKKETVAQFSFLMVLIPILGECLLDILKGNFSPEASGIPLMSLIVGFLTAFLSGFFACKWMLAIIQKGKWIYFSIYCAIVGLSVICYNFIC